MITTSSDAGRGWQHTHTKAYGRWSRHQRPSARERFTQTGMNPYATLHYINRELMELGLPSPLLLPELPECLEDNQARGRVSCWRWWRSARQMQSFREHTEDAMRVAMGEEDSLRATIGRLERELEQAQRAAAMANALATELRVTRANAASTKTQYVHEAKKRELEAGKLKERMQKLLVDKHRSAKVMFILANDVVRDRSGRPVDAATHEQLMLEDLVGKYESNEQQLVKRIVRLGGDAAAAGRHAGQAAMQRCWRTRTKDEAVQVVVERDGSVDMAPFVAMFESIRKAVSDERRRQQELSAADPAELVQRDMRIRELEAEMQALNQEIDRPAADHGRAEEGHGDGWPVWSDRRPERIVLRHVAGRAGDGAQRIATGKGDAGGEAPPVHRGTSNDGTPTNALLSSPRIASNGSPAQPAAPLTSSDMDVDDEQQAMRAGVKRSAARARHAE
ncbi:hypothetical protein DL89DRAFT_255086 [Linderina pennispora]|uniref:Uncharacterized protein n=1 Tax=Linderina pennispora TaxID=61395 RepID=A0A1Y1WHC7_9FUNG|nr:uncharacterized protein DL89DRAFT_255086 [Linderina pennispora]ORX72923.1 hypothetical protein DL89DRAFT_255086 [Linderina pennispora]